MGLTFIPLQLILRHDVCAAIKVFLERVHLPAQDISESLHLCQLLSQAVALLNKQSSNRVVLLYIYNFHRPQCNHSSICVLTKWIACVCPYKTPENPLMCADTPLKPMTFSATVNIYQKTHLEGGCGGGRVATGGWCERQHGAMSPQTGLWAISRIGLWRNPQVRKKREETS